MGGINDDDDDDEFEETNGSLNTKGHKKSPSNANYSSTAISKQDFKILKVIGRGSFGKVYLVQKKDGD